MSFTPYLPQFKSLASLTAANRPAPKTEEDFIREKAKELTATLGPLTPPPAQGPSQIPVNPLASMIAPTKPRVPYYETPESLAKDAAAVSVLLGGEGGTFPRRSFYGVYDRTAPTNYTFNRDYLNRPEDPVVPPVEPPPEEPETPENPFVPAPPFIPPPPDIPPPVTVTPIGTGPVPVPINIPGNTGNGGTGTGTLGTAPVRLTPSGGGIIGGGEIGTGTITPTPIGISVPTPITVPSPTNPNPNPSPVFGIPPTATTPYTPPPPAETGMAGPSYQGPYTPPPPLDIPPTEEPTEEPETEDPEEEPTEEPETEDPEGGLPNPIRLGPVDLFPDRDVPWWNPEREVPVIGPPDPEGNYPSPIIDETGDLIGDVGTALDPSLDPSNDDDSEFWPVIGGGGIEGGNQSGLYNGEFLSTEDESSWPQGVVGVTTNSSTPSGGASQTIRWDDGSVTEHGFDASGNYYGSTAFNPSGTGGTGSGSFAGGESGSGGPGGGGSSTTGSTTGNMQFIHWDDGSVSSHGYDADGNYIWSGGDLSEDMGEIPTNSLDPTLNIPSYKDPSTWDRSGWSDVFIDPSDPSTWPPGITGVEGGAGADWVVDWETGGRTEHGYDEDGNYYGVTFDPELGNPTTPTGTPTGNAIPDYNRTTGVPQNVLDLFGGEVGYVSSKNDFINEVTNLVGEGLNPDTGENLWQQFTGWVDDQSDGGVVKDLLSVGSQAVRKILLNNFFATELAGSGAELGADLTGEIGGAIGGMTLGGMLGSGIDSIYGEPMDDWIVAKFGGVNTPEAQDVKNAIATTVNNFLKGPQNEGVDYDFESALIDNLKATGWAEEKIRDFLGAENMSQADIDAIVAIALPYVDKLNDGIPWEANSSGANSYFNSREQFQGWYDANRDDIHRVVTRNPPTGGSYQQVIWKDGSVTTHGVDSDGEYVGVTDLPDGFFGGDNDSSPVELWQSLGGMPVRSGIINATNLRSWNDTYALQDYESMSGGRALPDPEEDNG